MPMIGIRELRERTADILRHVSDGTEYVITRQGRPVALLLPIDTAALEVATVEASKQAILGGRETYARLAESLHRAWPAAQRTQALIDDIRR